MDDSMRGTGSSACAKKEDQEHEERLPFKWRIDRDKTFLGTICEQLVNSL